VEVVEADKSECVAMNESQADIQGGQMTCLTGRTNYDYVSVSKGGGGHPNKHKADDKFDSTNE
jgi:hypothetical protein